MGLLITRKFPQIFYCVLCHGLTTHHWFKRYFILTPIDEHKYTKYRIYEDLNGSLWLIEFISSVIVICDTPQASFWINEIMRGLARAVKRDCETGLLYYSMLKYRPFFQTLNVNVNNRSFEIILK